MGLLALGQVGGVLEPQVATFLEFLPALLFVAADLVDGLVDDLDDVELVESDFGLGQAGGGAGDEGLAHVDTHLGDRLGAAAVGCEVGGEGFDGAGVLALGGKQHAMLVEIDEQADVVVAAARRGLIEGDTSDLGEIGLGTGVVDVGVEDAPQPGVVFAGDAGDGCDRHRREHGHDQGLEQQGEAAAGPRPRHGDLLDAARRAGDARHEGVQVGLVLEEVEMAPGHLFGVIGVATRSGAHRTGEGAAAREIEPDVELAGLGIEAALAHRPRRRQGQRHLKQFGIAHGCPPVVCATSVPPCVRRSSQSPLSRETVDGLDKSATCPPRPQQNRRKRSAHAKAFRSPTSLPGEPPYPRQTARSLIITSSAKEFVASHYCAIEHDDKTYYGLDKPRKRSF